MRPTFRSTVLGLAIAVTGLTGMALAASSLLEEQKTDQQQRDLIRIFSEVYQRARSRDVLGEVTRPKFGSPKIDLPDAATDSRWRPDCSSDIAAEPADPSQHPFALVLVPREEIGDAGASFTIYAIFAGDDPLPSGSLRSPLPEWLTAPIGGYRDLGAELEAIVQTSTVVTETENCGAFSIAVITGSAK